MSPSPRFGARRAPFDLPLFLRRLYLQPAALWCVLAALAQPSSRAAVTALGASCTGPLRVGADSAALIVYIVLVPALGAAAYHLAFARRRLSGAHRWVADLSLALVLAVSGVNAALLAFQAASRWSALAPGLAAVRVACWPGR
ncbi:MAG: hypothetical protein HKL90_16480 [Elusimicrobia bacterium]|nr:hypothetical protein [Elusimicrobiota bacterium]